MNLTLHRSLPAFFLVGGILTLVGVAEANNPPRPETLGPGDDVAYLRRQWNLFLSFPPAKQQRIRELDQELNSLPDEKLQHYRKVMENYLIWLDRLPEADRKKLHEPGMVPVEKLIEIRRIRLREWIATLPASYRKKWEEAKNDYDEQSKLLELWKSEQEAREEEWQLAQRHLSESGKENLTRLFENPEVKENLEPFLRNLVKFAHPLEKQLLENARQNVLNGASFEGGRLIYAIAERNPLLPGPDNVPRSYDSLPANVKALLPEPKEKANRAFREATARHANRWPDYAKAVTKYMQEQKLRLPQPLGPSKLAEMPEGVRTFYEKKLRPLLSQSEKGKKDLHQLESLEGSWPEYPEKFMEIAKRWKLTVPGWSLPAQELWDANFKVVKQLKNRP